MSHEAICDLPSAGIKFRAGLFVPTAVQSSGHPAFGRKMVHGVGTRTDNQLVKSQLLYR